MSRFTHVICISSFVILMYSLIASLLLSLSVAPHSCVGLHRTYRTSDWCSWLVVDSWTKGMIRACGLTLIFVLIEKLFVADCFIADSYVTNIWIYVDSERIISISAYADTVDIGSWYVATLHRASWERSTAPSWTGAAAAETSVWRPCRSIAVRLAQQSEATASWVSSFCCSTKCDTALRVMPCDH